MLFIRLSVFGAFVAYFGNFREDFTKDFVPDGGPRPKPNAWPFKSEKITWALVGITTRFWLACCM